MRARRSWLNAAATVLTFGATPFKGTRLAYILAENPNGQLQPAAWVRHQHSKASQEHRGQSAGSDATGRQKHVKRGTGSDNARQVLEAFPLQKKRLQAEEKEQFSQRQVVEKKQISQRQAVVEKRHLSQRQGLQKKEISQRNEAKQGKVSEASSQNQEANKKPPRRKEIPQGNEAQQGISEAPAQNQEAKKKPRQRASGELKRWQRDLLKLQAWKEEKLRLKELQRQQTMYEVEQRLQRRRQGLPEFENEEGEEQQRQQRRSKKREKKRPSPLMYPHVEKGEPPWALRLRNSVNLSVQEDEKLCHSHEQEKPERPRKSERDAELTKEELRQARATKRLDAFQRYVERLPEFEDFKDEDVPEESQERDFQDARQEPQELQKQHVSQEQQERPPFEIPPMGPGRGAVLVAGLYEILKEGKWDSEKVASLQKFKYAKLLPYQVCEVLKKLKDWHVGLEFFTWAKSIPQFRHDTLNYSTMIRNLGRCGHYIEARKLFDEMKENGIAIDIFTVNNMIKCYGSANRIDDAVALYRQIPTHGCQPDSCTYALLIDLFGKVGRINEMRQLFLDLKQTNFKPDAYVFNSMIYNLGKWGDIALATEAADQMKLSGVQYSTVTYATLIHMFAKVLDLKSAERTYNEYLQSHLPADLYVYNNVILFLGLAGRCREAEWAVEDIEKAGLAPDTFSYCTIISAWGREGCAREAKKWFDKAQSRGIIPSPEMCNALMDAYLKAQKLEPIEELLASMPRWGVKATLQTYTYLLNYYTDCHQDYVKFLRDLMHKTNHPADKFLDDIFGRAVPVKDLKTFSQKFFDNMRLEKSGWARKFANALVHYLQSFGYTLEAHSVWEGAAATRLFPRDVWEDCDGHWCIWLLDMEVGTALVALTQGLLTCSEKLRAGRPAFVTIISGYGTSKKTKVSLAVRTLLEVLRSPFVPHDAFAKFVCEGIPFCEWMSEPEVKKELNLNVKKQQPIKR